MFKIRFAHFPFGFGSLPSPCKLLVSWFVCHAVITGRRERTVNRSIVSQTAVKVPPVMHILLTCPFSLLWNAHVLCVTRRSIDHFELSCWGVMHCCLRGKDVSAVIPRCSITCEPRSYCRCRSPYCPGPMLLMGSTSIVDSQQRRWIPSLSNRLSVKMVKGAYQSGAACL